MTGWAIRPATEADLDAALAVEQAAFGVHAWTRAMLASELKREAGTFLIARAADGEVLGHAVGWAGAGTSEVLIVAVSPGHRRRGVGRALLGALEASAHAAGAEESWLEVRVGNAGAIALYEASGYARAGTRPRYYQDGEDALVLHKAALNSTAT